MNMHVSPSKQNEGLAGQWPLDEALMKYERRRNKAAMADYQENVARARFDPMPAKYSNFAQRCAAMRKIPGGSSWRARE
jgi:hypothetical protein